MEKQKAAILYIASLTLTLIVSCRQNNQVGADSSIQLPPRPDPRGYVCYRASSPVIPDGILSESDWSAVPWTEYFTDIEGAVKPEPRLKTHAKMLWDDTNLYIAAELEEPDVWAKLRQRDTVVFIDNDFEVFIDPDGDTHDYYELEVNAFATEWDLLLLKPYRDGGQAVNGWDIAGLKTGVHVNGTINNPADRDQNWTVEIVIPISQLKDWREGKGTPKAGDQWRIDFSRVEWRTITEKGTYRKEINPATGKPYPEDNWVWSPTGRINMHMPEMWGYLQFSEKTAGSGTEELVRDADADVKWALRMIYYAEYEYYLKNKKFTSKLEDTGLKNADFPGGLSNPVIEITRSTFESYFPARKEWSIYNDGRIIRLK